MSDQKDRVQTQFGEVAASYVTSRLHAEGEDLVQLVEWAEGGPDRVALDIATGGGHTALALAPLYSKVIATDLTPRMLEQARKFIASRGVTNVEFRRADAEDLPFGDGSFDTVSCRIAPHHFPDVARFGAQAARVLRPGGIFLLEDSIVPEEPELDEFLNRAEALRDPSHGRSLTASAWRQLVEGAGMALEAERVFAKAHDFEEWTAQSRTPEPAKVVLADIFGHAAPRVREAFRIEADPWGRVISYTDEKLALKARKSD